MSDHDLDFKRNCQYIHRIVVMQDPRQNSLPSFNSFATFETTILIHKNNRMCHAILKCATNNSVLTSATFASSPPEFPENPKSTHFSDLSTYGSIEYFRVNIIGGDVLYY